MNGGLSSRDKKLGKRVERKELKVKYISSPMKFQVSASEFRALVQELTGRDSDAERFVELNQAKKYGSPSQRGKNDDDDTIMPEVPAFSYHDNYSHDLWRKDFESSRDGANQGLLVDMLASMREL